MSNLHSIAGDTPVRCRKQDNARGGKYPGDTTDASNDMVMT